MLKSIKNWFFQFVLSKFMRTSKKNQNNHTKIVQKAIGNDITQIGVQNNYSGKEEQV